MIASIDGEYDISLYLTAKEVEDLPNKTIEGVLVKLKTPGRQGLVSISLNEERKGENGSNGIGVDDSKYPGVDDDFSLEVFMGGRLYGLLLRTGDFETRLNMLNGNKIAVYDLSRADFFPCQAAKNLEFSRDNKDNYLALEKQKSS